MQPVPLKVTWTSVLQKLSSVYGNSVHTVKLGPDFGCFCQLSTYLTGRDSGSQSEFLRDCVPVEGEWMREKGERENFSRRTQKSSQKKFKKWFSSIHRLPKASQRSVTTISTFLYQFVLILKNSSHLTSFFRGKTHFSSVFCFSVSKT